MNSDNELLEMPDFQHYFEIFMVRRWIVLFVASLVIAGIGFHSYTTIPLYRTKAMVIIEKEVSATAAQDTGTIEKNSMEYYNTQYVLLKSFSLMTDVHDKLKKETAGFQGTVEDLRELVRINPLHRTRLFDVEAVSDDPVLAARIANTVAETYVEQNINNQLHISKEILKALQVNARLEDGNLAHTALPAVVNNPVIANLEAQRTQLEADLAVMSNRYTPRHPSVVAIQSSMETLSRQIDRESLKIVQSLKMDLSGKLRGNNARVVDPARIPTIPFKPQKMRAMLLGTVAGVGLGFLVALLIELLDQTVRTPGDLESKLDMPSLGVIPFLAQDESRPSFEPLISPKLSLTSEAFRNMRTMVDLAGLSEKSKLFLVTSSVQGEGKTHIATNLAVAFSQLGQRVLLIDGDMRRPRLHKQFRLTSQHGLSEYLASGKDAADIQPLIQSTQIPNLQVLVCGPRPPNPSELLNTPRVAALVAWAKTNFDRVIVDCTPIYPIHDTLLWGRHIPSCLFTVRHGRTRVRLISNAIRSLKEAHINVLGVTINAAVSGGLTYAGYGYYYEQYYHDPEHTGKVASKA